MAKILVVDDEIMLLNTLVGFLRQSGYQADSASTLTEGLHKSVAGNYDIIFLDVGLPDGDGLEYLSKFKASSSAPEVIIITGNGVIDDAEKAILSDAWAYICKPDLFQNILLHITRALRYREEKKKSGTLPIILKRNNIISNSPQMIKCFEQVAQAASSDASVLITGETGTGKELIAKAIHENSKRSSHAFVIVDCAALPENLIESTLFGYMKGAFTGAEINREGLIESADGGTLFLDEVGELPMNLQKTFLRVLQEKSYRPVGSSREKRSNFRVIAATNRNIEESVLQGIFRNDLLYRLQALTFRLPPLRERKEDIKLLTRYFLARIYDRLQIQSKGISPDFIEHLEAYDWPGNVRQLQQTLEQVAAATVQHPTLFAKHLPDHFRIRQAQARIQAPKAVIDDTVVETELSVPLPWLESKKDFERKYFIDLMNYSKGKIKTACQISKLSRTRLYQLRDKYGMMNNTEPLLTQLSDLS